MANQNLELALKIKALVEGVDQVKGIANDIGKLQKQSNTPMGDPTGSLRQGISETTALIKEAQTALLEFFAFSKIKEFITESVDAFVEMEKGFHGLEAVANSAGINVGEAMAAAAKLSEDGLVKLSDAQRALQNLLSRGYDLSTATRVLAAIKDVASVARAQGLSIGDALVAASEGIKKGRTLQLEQSGVIVKLGDAWGAMGQTIDETTKSMTEAEKIQAESNAVMQFAAAYLGQAENAAKTLGNQMQKLRNENEETKAQLGEALAPAIKAAMDAGIGATKTWLIPMISQVEKLGIVAVTVANILQDMFHPGRYAAIARELLLAVDAFKKSNEELNGPLKFGKTPETALQKFIAAERADPKDEERRQQEMATILKQETEDRKVSVTEQIAGAKLLSKGLIDAFDQSLQAEEHYAEEAKKLRREAAQKPKDSSVEGQASATLDLIAAEQKLQRIKASAPLKDVRDQAELVRQLAAGLDDQARAQEAVNHSKLAEATALDKAAAAEKTQQAGITEQQKQNDARLAALEGLLKELTTGKSITIEANTTQANTALQQVKVIWDAIKDKTVTLTVNQAGAAAAIPGHAAGAVLPGYGGGDQRMILVEDGESITRKEAVAYYGRNFMAQLNAMSLPRFAAGGIVSALAGGSVATGASGLHPVTLNRPGVGSWPMAASPDVVAGLQSAIARETLKHGRR